ncbi:MAG: HAD family hydrolase [Bacteriovoracaceae bacterium]
MKFQINGNEILEDIELIIFDKDGVLVDLDHYWCEMLKLRGKVLTEKFFKSHDQNFHFKELIFTMGIDRNNPTALDKNGPIGSKPRSYVANLAHQYLLQQGVHLKSDDVEEAFKQADTLSLENFSSLLKSPIGVADFIAQAHARGLKMAIATSDISERAMISMRALGLENYFSLFIGSDCVKNCKPHPESIEIILNKLNIDRTRAMMIGDHLVDMEMAKKANLKYRIAVQTGVPLSEEAKKAATHIIPDLSFLRSN